MASMRFQLVIWSRACHFTILSKYAVHYSIVLFKISLNLSAVSESMMSYLAAEQLAARESLSDKDMMKVMADGAYKEELGVAYKPHPPMSALSLEEQRLLKSLDRLNNKLKGSCETIAYYIILTSLRTLHCIHFTIHCT